MRAVIQRWIICLCGGMLFPFAEAQVVQRGVVLEMNSGNRPLAGVEIRATGAVLVFAVLCAAVHTGWYCFFFHKSVCDWLNRGQRYEISFQLVDRKPHLVDSIF